MANVLTSSTLLQNSWKSMYDLLTDEDNGITDPSSRSKKWVFPDFPRRSGSDWPGYPIVTFMVDTKTEPLAFSKQSRSIDITFTFTVFSKNRPDYADSIADDIIGTIENHRGTLEAQKLYTPKVTSSPGTVQTLGENKIFMKTIYVDFMVRGL